MLIELHYLPCIEYFVEILKAEEVIIEASENYQKQSYRNRSYILGSHKVEILTVPIIHSKEMFIKTIPIDYSKRWWAEHLNCIQSAYGRSPFFEHYYYDIENIIHQKHQYLFDLNLSILKFCLTKLGISKKIDFSDSYQKTLSNETFDFREKIHPKKALLNTDIFAHFQYHQTFGKVFEKNLSIIDLLFNEGNNAKLLLSKMIQNHDLKT